MDEEIKTQTPVSVESTMNGLDQELIVYSVSAGGDAGAPSWGGEGGVVRLPPPNSKDRSVSQTVSAKPVKLVVTKPSEIQPTKTMFPASLDLMIRNRCGQEDEEQSANGLVGFGRV